MRPSRPVLPILLFAFVAMLAPACWAQLPQASDTTSPPTPGVGQGNSTPHYATTPNVPFSQGGWSYTFPMMTNTSQPWVQQYPGGKNYTCVETVNYVFQDPAGNRHNMGLAGIHTPPQNGCCTATLVAV